MLASRTAPHPPFPGLRIVGRAAPARRRARTASEPFALHHIQRKPWLQPLPPTSYSELLPRLWLADDLPLRLDAELRAVALPARACGEVERPRLTHGQVAAVRGASESARVAIDALVRPAQNAADDPSPSGTASRSSRHGAPLLTDLVAHRLECFEIRRRRRLGLPVPGRARAARAGGDRGEPTARVDAAAERARGIRRPHAADRRATRSRSTIRSRGSGRSATSTFSSTTRQRAQAALLEAGFVEVGDAVDLRGHPPSPAAVAGPAPPSSSSSTTSSNGRTGIDAVHRRRYSTAARAEPKRRRRCS